MKAISFVVFCAVLMVGCVQMDISDQSVCDEQSVMFVIPSLPSLPPGTMGQVDIPQISTTTSVNFSDVLSKVSGIASNVQVSVNQMTIDNPNGELNWVKSLEVDMADSNGNSTVLATYTSNGSAGSEITPTLVASPDTILQYFESGAITLTIMLGNNSGTMVDASTVAMLQKLGMQVGSAVHVCMSVSGQVSKSL